MLVLTRKVGEAVQIGEDISICVLQISAGRVRLGITAPRAISILRTMPAQDFDAPHFTNDPVVQAQVNPPSAPNY